MPDDTAPTNPPSHALPTGTPTPPRGEGPTAAAPSRRFGSPVGAVIAWVIVIVVAVAWIRFMQGEATDMAGAPVSAVGIQDELIGRLAISAEKLERDTGMEMGSKAILLQAEPLRTGSPAQRVAYAILLGAVGGPDRGRAELTAAETAEPVVPWSAADLAMRDEVHRRFETQLAGEIVAPLGEAESHRLGFFGELLDGSALRSSRAIVTLFVAVGWYAVVGIAGFVLLVTLVALGAVGYLRARCSPASPLGFVLIETFALWLCLFCGMQSVAVVVSESLGDSTLRLLIAPVMFFGSLVVLVWPRLRGVPWSVTRNAIGWRTDGVVGDVGWGALGYSISLPLLGAGLALALFLSWLVGVPPNATHPAIERISKSGPLGLANLFFLACVAAPIVEETMFRGVLYRHLRDVTGPNEGSGFGRGVLTALSVAVSAVISSAIFASIHPQGLVFAPVLAGLACGFCLVREWRGSIVPGAVAHGVANFVTLSLNVGLQSWLG
ncbi:MAG: CPBP family intramembrane glutamic endopeptidase [Phycisphaerales bacterium]